MEQVKHRSRRKTYSGFQNDLNIEKLRSQTFFFVEREPLVNTEFSLHVSNIVSTESDTFEAEKMRSFIQLCWSQHDKDFYVQYQEFVMALTEHVLTKFGHMRRTGNTLSDLARDQIFVS